MLTAYRLEDDRLVEVGSGDFSGVLWIDMMSPTAEEERAVEAALRIDVPTREDMGEIEASSRHYMEADVAFLTANVMSRSQTSGATLAPVTFILTDDRLVTVRYHDPQPFASFRARALKPDAGLHSAESVLIGLFETVTDRLADILEGTAKLNEDISTTIFSYRHTRTGKGSTLADVLTRIGVAEDLNGKVRTSVSNLGRLVGYLGQLPKAGGWSKSCKTRMKVLSHDLHSIADYAETQTQKITFLLDASLGMISIEQSEITKLFSVVAFVFLPPTLIASIYGMNFRVMPELHWVAGYPMALGLMLVSAILPYLFFKRRGWL